MPLSIWLKWLNLNPVLQLKEDPPQAVAEVADIDSDDILPEIAEDLLDEQEATVAAIVPSNVAAIIPFNPNAAAIVPFNPKAVVARALPKARASRWQMQLPAPQQMSKEQSS